jgi:hypothetical protein
LEPGNARPDSVRAKSGATPAFTGVTPIPPGIPNYANPLNSRSHGMNLSFETGEGGCVDFCAFLRPLIVSTSNEAATKTNVKTNLIF